MTSGLSGRTGSGKTKLMAAVAKIAGVPFYKADASALTEAGYVGDKPEFMIYGLLRQCDFNVEMANVPSCSSTRSTRKPEPILGVT